MKKSIYQGEVLRLLRTNSSGYPDYLVNNALAEVKFTNRKSALEEKRQRVQNGLMPFVTHYNSSVPNLKNILMSKWHLIQNQPLPREIYREPPFFLTGKVNL